MQLDRETAFVQTLTMAALIYTVAKNCSQRKIDGCECNSVMSLQKFDGDEPTTVYDCTDQIGKIGEKIAANLFASAIDTRFDGQAYANLHNNRAAGIVSIEHQSTSSFLFFIVENSNLLLRFIGNSKGYAEALSLLWAGRCVRHPIVLDVTEYVRRYRSRSTNHV